MLQTGGGADSSIAAQHELSGLGYGQEGRTLIAFLLRVDCVDPRRKGG